MLPLQKRMEFLASLTDDEAEALLYMWEVWARPEQLEPEGFWSVWLILAGRGFGKTRVGAEQVRKWARDYPYVNLIGATVDDARDIMIDGESGILAVCPDNERPIYRKSDRCLIWQNGAKSLIFTADEPERLRGKQHMKLWADELCAWRYKEAWDQAMLGLRLGNNPQAIVTTTPKPTKQLKELMENPSTVVTRGSTYDNAGNLAPQFFSHIIKKYEGSRLGRQELNAEILEQNQGALWNLDQLDRLRVRNAPNMQKVVVAVDPAVTSGEESDETGIIGAGRGTDGHFYVLADKSIRGKPEDWADAAVRLYYTLEANRIVAESNQGGDMVRSVIRAKDRRIPVDLVRASRGKAIRAEPVSVFYEQGQGHHVGTFGTLEDQMCNFVPGEIEKGNSPDRVDALVWAGFDLMINRSGTLTTF